MDNYQSINLYFQDESRFGLFTKNSRMLTARGVKPVCLFQQKFQSTYLFGAFSPINGDHLLLELPFCNGDTFQIFLEELSIKNPNEYKIVVLDNGSFHKTKSLIIPHNIKLIFLPPYSPELNPAESVWREMKRVFSNKVFKTLDLLSDFLIALCKEISKESIKSICSFPYIFFDSYWSTL